jgi:arabinose-5-phosphate isomerase
LKTPKVDRSVSVRTAPASDAAAPEPAPQAPKSYRAVAEQVLRIEAAAIEGLLSQLDEQFDLAVERIRQAPGRVICTGMGKSGHVMKKISATLSSTGSPSLFLHPAEAIHGDLGMIVPGDIVLAASFSGTSTELLDMVDALRDRDVPIIAITGATDSPLARAATLHLAARIDKEACPLNLAPTASTTATLALGDALAMALLEARGFTSEEFARFHPGGQLGRGLRRLEQIMHQGADLPRVHRQQPLREAIYEMSRGRLGITAVVDDEDHLVGVISDGDLRRMLAQPEADRPGLLLQEVQECMHASPKRVGRATRVSDALQVMEQHRITSLFVCDDDSTLVGVVHIHDLWGLRRGSA